MDYRTDLAMERTVRPGGMGEGVRRTYQEFRHAGVKDCTLKLYPEARHELLNERAWQDTVYQDIWNWMEGKL